MTRTAIVTGSTSGIGAATARALAAQGYTVLVTGRDKARGDAVVAGIRTDGGTAALLAWPDRIAPRQIVALNHHTPPAKLKRLLRGTPVPTGST